MNELELPVKAPTPIEIKAREFITKLDPKSLVDSGWLLGNGDPMVDRIVSGSSFTLPSNTSDEKAFAEAVRNIVLEKSGATAKPQIIASTDRDARPQRFFNENANIADYHEYNEGKRNNSITISVTPEFLSSLKAELGQGKAK